MNSQLNFPNHISILKNGELQQDTWQTFDQGIDKQSGDIIYPFQYWLDNREACLTTTNLVGLAIQNTDDLDLIKSDIPNLDLITLEFPLAVDGRAYSQAYLIRARFAFKGELRAVGDVHVDQLFLMNRCGFTAFSLDQFADPIQAAKYLKPFSESYQ